MSAFSSQLQAKIDGFLKRYETRRSAIIPILHAIQDGEGWIKEEHIEALETEYGLEKVHTREVLTFYSMLRDKKPRPFQVLFCDNIVCTMMGAKSAIERIQQHVDKLEQRLGENAPLGLAKVPCLGVCDGAPALLVNKDRHLHVTADKVDQLLNRYLPDLDLRGER